MACVYCHKKIAIKKIATITYADGTQKLSNAPVVVTTLDGTEQPVHAKCKIFYFADVAKQLLQPPTLPDDFQGMNVEDIIPIVLQAYQALVVAPLFQKVDRAMIKNVQRSISHDLQRTVITAYFQRGVSQLEHRRANMHCVDIDFETWKFKVFKNPSPHRQQLFETFLTNLDHVILKKMSGLFL